MGAGAVMEPENPRSIAAADPSDRRLARLRQVIVSRSLMRGDFTLTSGRKSNYLFQLRQTTLHGEGSSLIARLIIDFMKRLKLTCIGGLVQGAVPIVSAVAPVSWEAGYPVDVFFVRREAKQHGAKELVDGYMNREADVLVVDDVTTSGKSMLDAVAGMREEGYLRPIVQALSIIDREEGASENLAKQGIRL